MQSELAVSRTITGEPITPRMAHFALFDAVRDPALGYSITTVFEQSSPGIRDSLLVWSALHSLQVECRTLSANGQPFKVWSCRVNDAGAVLEVQCSC